MATSPTYPGDRSNEPEKNQEPFRDLAIINQPAGHLEFINTKDDEMMDLGYRDGSFYRFNKFAIDEFAKNDKRVHIMGDSRTEIGGNVVNIFNKNVENIQLGDSITKVGDVDKWQSYQEKIKAEYRDLHDDKQLFEIKRVKVHNYIDQAPAQEKSGTLAACPIEATTSKMIYTVNPTIFTPSVKSVCGHQPMSLRDNETIFKSIDGSGGKISSEGWGCLCCWGTGDSPSSQDGDWDVETVKAKIAQKKVDIQDKILDFEKHLGQNSHRDGGTEMEKISKDYFGMFGLAFNDFESFRKDPKGKLVPATLKVDPFGSKIYVNYRESSLVENVNVERFPGGNYDLVVCDGYNLTVGSNGINIKTTGSAEIFAPIINITAEDLTLNSRGDFRIGGERVDITAEIITLRPKKKVREIEDASGNTAELPANGKTETEEEQQVLIDGGLGVATNLIVKGGSHLEGEVTLQHVTAPCEYLITEADFEYGLQSNCSMDSENATDECSEPFYSSTYADIIPGCIIGYAIVASGSSAGAWPVYSTCAPNSVMVHPHRHFYKSMPLKLVRDNIETEVTVGDMIETKTINPNAVIRAIGALNNKTVPVLPKPVQNSKTEHTVLNKFGGSSCDKLVIGESWGEANESDTLPEGEGVRTASYTDAQLFDKVKELEDKLESKYKELQEKLAKLT